MCILLQLLLHGHHLLLHLVELLHLLIDGQLLDLGLLLLGLDLSRGPSALGADLEEVHAAAMVVYEE